MPSRPDVQEFLGRTRLLHGLDPPVLAAVAAAVSAVSFAAGELIFSRGDAGNALFLVTAGRVRLSILTSDGRELSFDHAVPGDVFGEIAAIDGSPRSADATALTAVKALVLPTATLKRLVAQHPSLGWAIMRFLCARLRDVSDHLEDIALFPLEARLARFLLTRLGNDQMQATAGPISLGMSQSELALLLGASRQKVNSALAALEETGAIRRSDHGLVCTPAALRQIARQD